MVREPGAAFCTPSRQLGVSRHDVSGQTTPVGESPTQPAGQRHRLADRVEIRRTDVPGFPTRGGIPPSRWVHVMEYGEEVCGVIFFGGMYSTAFLEMAQIVVRR